MTVIAYDFRRDNSDAVTLAESKLKRSRTFRRHADRLKGRAALLENEIKALCWALNGVKAANLGADDREELRALLDAREERPITREHAAKGIEWLRRLTFKANGEVRQSKSMPFDKREVGIIRNFKRFTWVGVFNTQEHFGNFNGCKSYVPVWRTYAKDGSYFDYVAIGGGPGGGVDIHIVGRG